MNKYLLVFSLSFLTTVSIGQSKADLNTIREELFYTQFNLEKCQAFYEKLIDFKRSSPTIMAYEAAAKALIAKHSWNPFTKISFLKESLNLLEVAIHSDKSNPELRFLRLYIENSIPSYLGMNKNLEADKRIIISNMAHVSSMGLDAGIISYIKDYMSSKAICTNDELKLLKASVL